MVGSKSTYVGKPDVPLDVMKRLQVFICVASNQITKKQAMKELGCSKPRLHTLIHRAEQALIDALTPSKGGRPAQSAELKALKQQTRQLQRQIQRLEREKEKLRIQNEALRMSLKSRPRERSRRGGLVAREDDEMAQECLLASCQMHSVGLSMAVIALALCVGLSTLRRWSSRARNGERLVNPRGPAPRLAPGEILEAEVIEILDEQRGQTGAVVLSKTTGGSRRACATVKADYLRNKERERKRTSLRVRISFAGLMRSFDQLFVHIDGIKRVVLVCADALVPFRTSITLVDAYDAENVARVIAADIARWGPPLIWRFDRAKSHLTKLVLDLLDGWGVLPLCGPPRYPGYYGQMERMNLEHRQWLRLGPLLTAGNIAYELDWMRTVLNERVIRPILNYRTAAGVWEERSPPTIDRRQLKQEVYDLASGRYGELAGQRDAEQISWRWAMETAMTNRGLVSIERGAWS